MSIKDAMLLATCATAGALAGRAFEDPRNNVQFYGRVNGLAILAAYCAGKVWQPDGKMGTLLAATITGGASGLTNCAVHNKNERASAKSALYSALAGTAAAYFVEKYVIADL